jgi:hypothetical protein
MACAPFRVRLESIPASCTLGLAEDVTTQLDAGRRAKYESLTIIDSIAWCRHLLPSLEISRKLKRIAVHPTCSMTHLGLAGTLGEMADHLADEVDIPIGTTCCGTAGDRGLLHPERILSAPREVRAELRARPAEAYISANRTCETRDGTTLRVVRVPPRGTQPARCRSSRGSDICSGEREAVGSSLTEVSRRNGQLRHYGHTPPIPFYGLAASTEVAQAWEQG